MSTGTEDDDLGARTADLLQIALADLFERGVDLAASAAPETDVENMARDALCRLAADALVLAIARCVVIRQGAELSAVRTDGEKR